MARNDAGYFPVTGERRHDHDPVCRGGPAANVGEILFVVGVRLDVYRGFENLFPFLAIGDFIDD